MLQAEGEQDGLYRGGVPALRLALPTLPLHVGAVPRDGAAGGTLDIDGRDQLVLIDQPVLDHLGWTRTGG